jgi:poly(3-hydroxybutyrate) depolymerase
MMYRRKTDGGKMMRAAKSFLIVVVVLLAELSGVQAQAQARDTIAIMRTRYNTFKTQANAQGELKAKFDQLDQEIARAAQLGRTGELRRLYTQGMALAQNRPWNADTEFAASLALQTDHVFVDPSSPVSFKLTQIYLPSIELTEPLSMRVTLTKPGTGGAPAQGGEKLKDVGLLINVGRDLIDSPFKLNVDFSGIEGRTAVRAELIEGGRTLGTTTLNMEVHKGLRDRLSRLESTNADVRYPLDYIANVDKGNIAVGQFDYEKELALAETALAGVKAGKDPFAGKTGDFRRHYYFEEAGEIMPYRVYVPSSYKGDRSYPLFIALHGNGLTENYFFDNLNGNLQKLAEEHGYIVAAPLGYRVDGGYGYNNGSRPAEDTPKLQLSEKDVMHVVDLMRRDYRIDSNRIYIGGHSMGGSGSWYLGPKYSQIWAGLATFAGGVSPASAPQVKTIPQFVVHGNADTTAPVERSRTMVAELKRLGIEHQYVEVPGGSHGSVVAPNLAGMFDFFDRHRK